MSTYLAHHGILGMRWGVRRWQNKDGTRTARGKARYSKSELKRRVAKSKDAQRKASAAAASQTSEKNVKDMTNEELNAAVNRMRLEQNYLQLISSSQTKTGETKMQQYMSKFGNTLADKLVQDAAQTLSKKIVAGILGDPDNGKKKKKDD